MRMDKGTKYIEELIFRSFRCECTDEEIGFLEEWRNETPENQRIYQEIVELSEYRQFLSHADLYDAEKAYPVIRRKLNRPRGRRKLLRYAAAVLIPVSVAMGVYLSTAEYGAVGVGLEDVIFPGGPKALLYLSDGKVIDLKRMPDATITDGTLGGIKNENGSLLNYCHAANTSTQQEQVYHKISIPRGGEYSVVLSDGTRVMLNAGSVLEYPLVFAGDRREVRLSGEAYFDVAKDAEHPFFVVSSYTSIEVTGTSFNVSAYPDDNDITAVLESGSINFHACGEVYPVKPGECAQYDKQGEETTVTAVDTDFYTSWRNGLLRFDDAPMSEITRKLARWYDVEFVFADRSICELHFSGATQRDKPLNHILHLLENTQDLKFSTEDNKTILISKK